MAAEVIVDVTALDELGINLVRAKRALISRLGERGYQLFSEEVPVLSGNLKLKGVRDPIYDFENLTATIVVSATRDARGPTIGEVHYPPTKAHPEGHKKTVTLRPSPAYNYAEAVARGRPSISPKNAKALLIPVPTVPIGEAYILAGGQIYIMRRSAAATAPNPFDERAAMRLDNEKAGIGEAVLSEFL